MTPKTREKGKHLQQLILSAIYLCTHPFESLQDLYETQLSVRYF